MQFVYSMMQHITGMARNQMFFTSLDQTISDDHIVRCIDVVENIKFAITFAILIEEEIHEVISHSN
jgi:hypothetical protein